MDNILELIEESNNMLIEEYDNMIELQAMFYLENLTVDFMLIKESMTIVTEAINRERIQKIREAIQQFCKRIVNMLNTFIEALQNMFMKTEQFVEKYGENKIKEAMRSCNETLPETINIYNPIGLAVSKIKYLQERIRIDDITTEEDIYLALKLKGKEQIEKEIKEIFINKDDVRVPISRINSATAIGYMSQGNESIDLLRKTQKNITNDANRVIGMLQRSEEVDTERIAACKAAMGIKLFIVQSAIKYINQGVKEHAKLAKKAMGYQYVKDNKDNN